MAYNPEPEPKWKGQDKRGLQNFGLLEGKDETMLRAGCNAPFCPASYRGTYKKEHDQSSTRGQVGEWEVKKGEIWAVWLGKSELEGLGLYR